jgi:hypothetical protein
MLQLLRKVKIIIKKLLRNNKDYFNSGQATNLLIRLRSDVMYASVHAASRLSRQRKVKIVVTSRG